MASTTPTEPRKDPYKDTLWRFLGYANEVGEALRPLVPVGFVWATYAVAIGYAAGDTYDKASYEYEVTKDVWKSVDKGAETAVWQTLASVTVPPLFINQVVKYTRAGLISRGFAASRASGMASLAGLAAIPVIFKPIDHATDLFIERVYRPIVRGLSKRETSAEV